LENKLNEKYIKKKDLGFFVNLYVFFFLFSYGKKTSYSNSIKICNYLFIWNFTPLLFLQKYYNVHHVNQNFTTKNGTFFHIIKAKY